MNPPRRRASDQRRGLYPLLITLGLVLVLAFLVFRYFLLIFTVAASVGLLLAPVQRRLTRWLRGRPALASGLLVVAVTLVILVPTLISMVLLGNQAGAFADWLRPRVQISELQRLWTEILPGRFPWLCELPSEGQDQVMSLVAGTLSEVVTGTNRLIRGILAGLTSALFDLLLFLMMLFFLLKDGGRLRAQFRRVSPFSESQEDEILDHVGRTVKGVLEAMVLVPFAQGLIAMLGFFLFGLPSPVLWGVGVMLAALVPILGSPLGWIPAVVYLAATGEPWRALGMLGYGVLVISTTDNVVKPLVLQEAARIHPMLGFLSILGGFLSFGPLGFMVGPVVLSLVLSALRIYRLDVLHHPVLVRAGDDSTGEQA
jgi:predicted PurR-regulated permease PerM